MLKLGEINNNVGSQGFICPKTEEFTPYDHCFMSCKQPCMSIPLLLALAKQRGVRVGYYSTTEIYNPPQVVWLKRNTKYYEKPKSLIWATLGTAWHNVIEDGLKQMNEEERKHYHIEHDNYFEIPFKNRAGEVYAYLTGRPDMWVDDVKMLRDFKTMKYYTCKKLKAGDWEGSTYHWQLNTYMWWKYPEAEILELECIIKDWQTRYTEEGISEYEIIPVPRIPEEHIKQRSEHLIALHSNNQKNPKLVQPCSKEDVWMQENPRSLNDGVPLRCRDYCAVHAVCPQARKWYKENGGWRNADVVNPKRPQIIQQTMCED